MTWFLDHLDDKRAALLPALDQPWPGAKLLEKPVQLDALASTIERLLKEHRALQKETEI